jgi:hypothetical protein
MKLALLVGINYINMTCELNGCINDTKHISNMLVHTMGYNPDSIVVLTDDQIGGNVPTKQNIIDNLKSIIRRTREEQIEELWFSFSGHGVQREDVHSEEIDRKDECLLPVDYKENGVIRDDVLHSLLSGVADSTITRVLIDACHSGTMLDLPYRYDDSFVVHVENRRSIIKNSVYMISGCMDNQTSSDATIKSIPQGAMTRSFIHSIEKDSVFELTWFRLLSMMRTFLTSRQFRQVPQLSCSEKLTKESMYYL